MHRIREFLKRLAYPSYECEDCIGMIHYGCECSHHGGIAPGIGPKWYHKALRWLLERNNNNENFY